MTSPDFMHPIYAPSWPWRRSRSSIKPSARPVNSVKNVSVSDLGKHRFSTKCPKKEYRYAIFTQIDINVVINFHIKVSIPVLNCSAKESFYFFRQLFLSFLMTFLI